MTDRELMQQALDALEEVNSTGYRSCWKGAFDAEIELLRARLAQPELEQTKPESQARCKHGVWSADHCYQCEAQPEPPCKTGSQCIGGKCPQCVVDESEPVAVVASLNESAQEALLSEGHTLMAPLYTAPPQRKWQGLTDEGEILELSKDAWGRDRLKQGRADHTGFYVDFARAIEAKLKEKNT